MKVEIKRLCFGSQKVVTIVSEVDSWEDAIASFKQMFTITELLSIKKLS